MVDTPPRKIKPPDPFLAALSRLVSASRDYLIYSTKTETELAVVQSLVAEVQLAAPPNVTIPPFRREIWPIENIAYVPTSTDKGMTWVPSPQYRTRQLGSRELCERWIRELQGIADAVLRRIEARHPEEPSKESEPPVILSLGNRRYQIGMSPIVHVTPGEDAVLETLLEHGALDAESLVDKSGYKKASRIFHGLLTKYNRVLSPALQPAEKRGGGGYRANIRRAEGTE